MRVRPHEFSFYSTGKWHTPQRYIVGWAGAGVVKVGITFNGRRRYGAFLSRGGELLDLRTYKSTENIDAEGDLEYLLEQRWLKAFQCKEDAEPILGGRGGGYLECFRIPEHDWNEVLDMVDELEGVRLESERTPSGVRAMSAKYPPRVHVDGGDYDPLVQG